MIIIEVLMLLTGTFSALYSSITDFRTGKVPNKTLFPCFAVLLILNILYYALFCKDLFVDFVLNIVLLAVIAAFLFFLHMWGGGDTKLAILLALSVPARFYFYYREELFPILNYIIFIFSAGYIFLVIQTTVFTLRDDERTNKPFKRKDLFEFIRDYIICFVYITFLTNIFQLFIPEFYADNSVFFMFINIALVLLLFSTDLSKKYWIAGIIAVLDIAISLYRKTIPSINVISLIIIALLYFLRRIISIYNYETIEKDSLLPGMILSSSMVLLMSSSRDPDIPRSVSEDMSSRLTEKQVIAVTKWLEKHPDIDKVTIVRKMPFALFIALGFLMFSIMGLFV